MAGTGQSTGQHGLMAGAIGLGGDFVASIATVAPSSSVAFTLALLLGFSGQGSPLAVLVVGAAMTCAALGYASLNRWRAHAGAPYVWVGAAVNPVVGIGTGLLSALASTLANIGNITLAGAYLIFVILLTHTSSNFLVWLAAAAIMAALLWLSIRGIRPSIWVQIGAVVVEYSVVISFVVLALIHEASGAGGARLPSLSDFSFSTSLGGFKGLAEAAVVCGFLYAGWESPSVLGEESTKARFNPGRAMILGTAFLTVWYTFLILVFEGVSSQAALLSHGTDVLAYAGTLLAPGPFGRLLPIAVLIAVIGTTQMQMTEPSRIMYALARDQLIPKIWGVLHQAHRTPWIGLTILAIIPPVFLVPYLVSASANTAIGDVISAAGMLYLFMYFVIAVSSVWFYREHITTSGSAFVFSGILPLVGGVFMLVIFAYGLTTQIAAVSIVAAVGVVLIYVAAAVIRQTASGSPFFAEMAQRKLSGHSGADFPAVPEAAGEPAGE